MIKYIIEGQLYFHFQLYAPVAELADAPDLGSGVPDVKVQVLSGAPNSKNPNPVPVGNGFGFLIYLEFIIVLLRPEFSRLFLFYLQNF